MIRSPVNDVIELEKDLSILNNSMRLKIVLILFQSKKALNYMEIVKEANIDVNKLAYHVALLREYCFLEKKMMIEGENYKKLSFEENIITEHDNTTNRKELEYSYYLLTSKAINYLEWCID